MQTINIEELINYKILPFNLYSKDGELLFATGEVLTPGKFLQLRNEEVIYSVNDDELDETEKQKIKKTPRMPINVDMPLSAEIQSELQCFCQNALKDKNELEQFARKIKFFVETNLRKVTNLSQLRLVGDYENCRLINIAILSALYLQKKEQDENTILKIIIEALSNQQKQEIIKVIAFFEDLAFNKTENNIENVKDALKVLIEQGTKIFSADIVYSFVYTFNYNDTKSFTEIKK